MSVNIRVTGPSGLLKKTSKREISPQFLVLVFKEKFLYICFTVFSNIQETQLHGSSVLLPFEAAGANGQEGESIRYWKEMEKKKGITYGSLLLSRTVAQPPDLLILRTLPNSDQLRI